MVQKMFFEFLGRYSMISLSDQLTDHHVMFNIENYLRQFSSYIIGVTLLSHSLAKFLVTKIISDFVLISDLVSLTPENSKNFRFEIWKFQANNSDQPQENVFYIKWFHRSWLGLHWRYQSRPRIWFQCLTIDGNIENIITKCLILFGISSSCPEFRIYNIWYRCRFYFYRRYKNFETFLHGCHFRIRWLSSVIDPGALDQVSSGHRRPGSLKLSFPSLKSLRTSLFSPITFVVGEQTSGIKSRSLRTKPRNLETLFGWVIKLCLRTSDNYSSNDWRILRRRRFGKFSALRIDVRFKNKSDYRLSIRNGVSWLKSRSQS